MIQNSENVSEISLNNTDHNLLSKLTVQQKANKS